MNIRIPLALVLLVATAAAEAYHTTQPTPNIQDTHVSAHAVYNPTTFNYTYSYTITSGPANTGNFRRVNIDISSDYGFNRSNYVGPAPGSVNFVLDRLDTKGRHIVPVTMSAPSGWRTSAVNLDRTASWGTSFNNITSVSGLTLTAGYPPMLRQISVRPRADFYLDTEGEEGDPAIAAMEKAYYASLTYTTWTLGPGGRTGSQFGDWDQFRDTLNKAIQIGWVPNAPLANNLVAQLAQARTDFEAGHDTAAKDDLRALLATIAASTDSQRRAEVADLVSLYATGFLNSLPDAPVAPIPYDPLIKLSPAAVTLPLGQTYALTATAINVAASDAPIPGSPLSLSVTSGPDAGLQLNATTDGNGQALFSFVGTRVGTDKITVSMPGAPVAGNTSYAPIAANTDDVAPFLVALIVVPPISAQAQVTWAGGPDLVVPLFSPPYIESQAGATIQIRDMTANQGTTDAGASITRYYLSTLQPPFDVTQATVIGERPVPVLAPGTKSNSGLHPFVLPSSLPAGQYFMAACADANNAVAELDETNNCSWSQLKTGNAIIIPVKHDNFPPDCSQAYVTWLRWLPRHQLDPASIQGVTDPDGDAVTIRITKITVGKPGKTQGDDDTRSENARHGESHGKWHEDSDTEEGWVYIITDIRINNVLS